MKKLLLLFAMFSIMGLQIYAQTTVTGVVTDDAGSELPGVNVLVKGTNIGTMTMADGSYSIEVPEGSRFLIFSYIGMESKEITITGSEINCTLKPSSEIIDEVVVTALGVSKEKKSLGYSVQGISGDELTEGNNPNIMTAISGKIAGLEVRQSSGMPGAPVQIFIRGARSFNGNNTPLYVIDGMPVTSGNDYGSNTSGSAYSNRALDIDPNDIESINVLKGQSATALYGTRASNGVILITTKKGGKGEKTRISYNSSYTIDKVGILPELQQTYAQGTGGNFVPANSFSYGPKIVDLPDDPVYGGNSQGHPGMFFDPYKGDWVTPQAYNAAESFFGDNGSTWSNSINISNSGERGSFSIGLGNSDQKGIVSNTGMQRYTAKLAGRLKMTDRLYGGFSGNYVTNSIQKLPSGNDSWLFTVFGSPASYDFEGTPYHIPDNPYNQISYRRGAVGVNPLWAIENNHYNETTKRFFGNTYIEYKPFDWVKLKYQIGADVYSTNNQDYIEMGYGDHLAAGGYPSPSNPEYDLLAITGGQISNYGIDRQVINSLFTAEFAHRINEVFGGSLMLGNEVNDNQWETYYAQGLGFSSPGWNNLDNTSTQFSGHSAYHRRTVGFFGELSLDYLNMLYFTATGRYDIVSSMPSENRAFFYPSAGLGFVFTELAPLKGQDIVSFGKLRMSYAQVGQPASTFNASDIFVVGGGGSGMLENGMVYPLGGITGYMPSAVLYDPELQPQNTSNIEFGLEVKFLKNRIGLDYTFFIQDAKNQIFGVPMAGSTGYSTLFTNAGQMKNIGHEIIFNATPLKYKNFTWDISVNFTKIENEVVELAEGVESISLGGYTTPNIRASAGDSYPAIYGDMFARDSEGRILVNEDPASPGYGMPMAGEFGKIGEVTPDFIMGFRNAFTLFNIVSISAFVEWKNGGQIYSGSNRLINLYGSSAITEDRDVPFIYDGYKSDGSPNDIERGGTGDPDAYEDYYTTYLDAIDEAYIMDASFLKLRDVTMNVSLPKKILGNVFESVNVGFSVRNILLWSAMDNFDPETSQGQGNMQGGMDYMSLPQTKSFGVNLNITF